MTGNGRHAFSLTELVVALVIFEIGVLGALSLGVLAAREMARAAAVQRATGAAAVVADSLIRFEVPGEGSTDIGPHTVRWWREDGVLRVEAGTTGAGGGSPAVLVRMDLPVGP